VGNGRYVIKLAVTFWTEGHVHISKNEKVKVYLRMKPSMDAAQTLTPP
jgi:hypothetical protein